MKKILFFIISFFILNIKLSAINNISVNNQFMSPSFDKEVHTYNIYTLDNVEIITINVISEENETITGSGSKSLKKGLNTFQIISYIDNIKEIYTLNIIRGNITYDENDSYLKELSISGYDINFDKDIDTYTIDKNSEDILYIKYASYNPKAIIRLNETKDNIEIEVISENKKNKKLYTININNNELNKEIIKEKVYTDKELKIIRLSIIFSIIILLVILLIFLIKKKTINNSLYIKHSILHKLNFRHK